jgi:hypothetical protein
MMSELDDVRSTCKNSNNKVILASSDVIANRNLGCRNVLAQKFRIALPIRAYFKGLFCLPEDGNHHVCETRCCIFYFEHKATEHLQIMKNFKFVFWALKLMLSLRTAAYTVHTRIK